MIQKLFNQIDKWRLFPAYQLERRVDVFFSLYLPDILKTKFGHTADFIIPEFPVHRGSIYEMVGDHKSVKIDFVSVDQSRNEVLLIELKTDMRSRRDIQDDYLLKAQKLNIPDLIEGITQIYKATKQKNKYNFLMAELIQVGWLKKEGNTFVNTSHTHQISVVYIQPINPEGDKNTICFEDIIALLNTKKDEFSKRFAKSLVQWKVNPNQTRLEKSLPK
jgi:hypothetical protein